MGVSTGEIAFKQISNRIAQMSTVNRADVMAVLDCLVQAMQEELAEGNIVRLGEFGSFMLTLRGTGEDKKEDVTMTNVTGVSLRFKPGKELKQILKTLDYQKTE